MKPNYPTLFTPVPLGNLHLKNRIVMAPMTRSRAIGHVPNELMVKYYSDRADAGLIITEGASPSPNGLGYARIPGLYNEAQLAGWKAVTTAVHANGGKIFLQLMHSGRISHALNMPDGARVVAPSPIAAAGQMWTDQEGMQAFPVPQEIPLSEIQHVISEYVESARLAINAGFDGVEIHAANGYLPMQFLNPGSNQRTDAYGGNPDARNRFVLELAAAIASEIGKDKTGIRLSPFGRFNDMAEYDGEEEQYIALAKGLQQLGLAYLHMLTFQIPETAFMKLQAAFTGPIILNGGYTADKAEADLASRKGSLVAFGTPFIANPDLVHRFADGLSLATADQATFYSPGAAGYTDYPAASVISRQPMPA